MNYKPIKTLEEQVDYIESSKKVTYTSINKEQAKEILYTHSYINVITPYKHRFALKDDITGQPLKENGKHVYPSSVEFNDYYRAYTRERSKYPKIYKNLMNFEVAFNSIVAYEVEQYYQLDNDQNCVYFFEDLMRNSETYLENHPHAEKMVIHMQESIEKFPDALEDYKSVYIFLDRLMLNDLVTIFRCCNESTRSKIFKSLLNRNMTFDYKTFASFDIFLTKYIQIRNYVCHFSSLEVLINDKDFKNKTFRHKSQRDSYKKAIAKLSQ